MATKKSSSTKSSKQSKGASKKSSPTKSSKSARGAKSSGKKTTRKTASKTSKRTLIEPHKGDRRYVRRNKQGEFKSEVNVGRSLAADRRHKSSKKVVKGQGDRGDSSPGIVASVTKSVSRTVRKVLKKF